MKILKEKWALFLTLSIYTYMFLGGYIISKLLYKDYSRYFLFDLDKYILLYFFIGISIIVGYFLGEIRNKIVPTKKSKKVLVKINAIKASFVSLFIGLILIFERVWKLKFLPFWLYDPLYISTINESGYPGIGLAILSISIGLDYILFSKYKREKLNNSNKILLILLTKIGLLLFYSRSRGMLMWVILIIFWEMTCKNINIRKMFRYSLVVILFLLLYRIISEMSVSRDFEFLKFKLLFDIAPEFKDLSGFLEIFKHEWFPNIRVELLKSYMFSLLPESVWSILGLNKFSSIVSNIGAFAHELMYGSNDVGVRLTMYGDFFMFGNKLWMIIGGLLIGYTQSILDKRKKSSLLAFLMIINIAYSQLFNVKAMIFRIIPIILIVIIYDYQWYVLSKKDFC